MSPTAPDAKLLSRLEVLADLESTVDGLIVSHESKRRLWWPCDLIGAFESDDPDRVLAELRERARGISDPARIALALNLVTEEGLPHFHRLLAVHLGDDSFWRRWNNLWTAEEDRHGAVIHDYLNEARLVHTRALEQLQFEYVRNGFHPVWWGDPYRLFAYTTLQERATQVSHANTGRLAGAEEPVIGKILARVAAEEARHFHFYRQVFAEILQRDPNPALEAVARVMPALEMPGVSMPNFREMSEVIRRAGVYGPREYLRIVEEQIQFWHIETLTGLNETGRQAQERILQIPARLAKLAERVEARTAKREFSFELVFNRTFAMA